MENMNILISTDCTSDLTLEYKKRFGIYVMYGYVITEEGRYMDPNEVTADNLMEYMEEEKKEAYGDAASIEEYKEYFEKLKERTQNPIIHITAARHVSTAYAIALEAAANMENVFVVDSGQISGGLGLVVIKAADLAARGASLTVILDEIQKNSEKVFSSFIADTSRYLYKNGNISEGAHKLCQFFGIRPILKISKSHMVFGAIGYGNKRGYVRRYIRWALRRAKQIDTDIVYVISNGCSYEYLEYVKAEIMRRVHFQKIIVNDASASISANCGPGAISVLFARK